MGNRLPLPYEGICSKGFEKFKGEKRQSHGKRSPGKGDVEKLRSSMERVWGGKEEKPGQGWRKNRLPAISSLIGRSDTLGRARREMTKHLKQ